MLVFNDLAYLEIKIYESEMKFYHEIKLSLNHFNRHNLAYLNHKIEDLKELIRKNQNVAYRRVYRELNNLNKIPRSKSFNLMEKIEEKYKRLDLENNFNNDEVVLDRIQGEYHLDIDDKNKHNLKYHWKSGKSQNSK